MWLNYCFFAAVKKNKKTLSLTEDTEAEFQELPWRARRKGSDIKDVHVSGRFSVCVYLFVCVCVCLCVYTLLFL